MRHAHQFCGIGPATVSDFENRTESSKHVTLFNILAALNLQLDVTSRDINENKESHFDLRSQVR
jgi:hypothetical protein